jgi:4-hydroxy-2-oxoheptanedioate aldolase
VKPILLPVAMREKKLSLGLYFMNSSPELMEIAGVAGFNHVIIDHMFTGIDWGTTAHMVRAAQLFGVSPIVRVQTYPWGSEGRDVRVAAEVARALGIGASGAMISIGSVTELERALQVRRDLFHKRIHLINWLPSVEEDPVRQAPEEKDFIVLPLIELPSLMDQIDEIVSLEGLKAIALGMGDMCKAVGHPSDDEHEDVWKFVDKAVRAAEPHGIAVWVNIYLHWTLKEIVGRIERLWKHGIYTIQVQTPEAFLRYALHQVAVDASKRIGEI